MWSASLIANQHANVNLRARFSPSSALYLTPPRMIERSFTSARPRVPTPRPDHGRAYLADVPNVALVRGPPGIPATREPADFACAILVRQHLPPDEAHDLLHRIAGR